MCFCVFVSVFVCSCVRGACDMAHQGASYSVAKRVYRILLLPELKEEPTMPHLFSHGDTEGKNFTNINKPKKKRCSVVTLPNIPRSPERCPQAQTPTPRHSRGLHKCDRALLRANTHESRTVPAHKCTILCSVPLFVWHSRMRLDTLTH